MERICLTSLMDIDHGLIMLQTWSKMAHGVITWLCMRLQIAIKCTFVWLAVSQITVSLLSSLMATWSAPTHLCWAMFMNFTMLACNPNKVRLHIIHCFIREFVCNLYVYHSTEQGKAFYITLCCKTVFWPCTWLYIIQLILGKAYYITLCYNAVC